MKQILFYTFLFWFSGGCFAKILFLSIQRGQWLDKLLGWQNKLRNWDISGTQRGVFFSKIGGYCELCFSHAIAFLNFWAYLWFLVIKSHFITYNVTGVISTIFLTILWYLIFVSSATIINLWFIVKLFNTKK